MMERKMAIIIAIFLLLSYDFNCNARLQGRYSNDIDQYETVIPHRISSEGNLVSYFIPEYYDRNVANERRRRESAEDDTVHYGLQYQDQYFKLALSPYADFISPGLVVEYKSDNPRMKRVSDTQCHYRGYVLGQEDSSAALSVCDGMAGYVRINKDMFFIEPADGFEPQSDGKHVHLIYKRSVPPLEETLGRCTSGDDWQMSWTERLREEVTHNPGFLTTLEKYMLKKGKHHSGEESLVRHLEAAIVCDKKFVQFYKGRDMETYILTVMNMVAGLYHDASIGNLINFVVVRVIYLEKEEQEVNLKLSTDADKSLTSFCDWQVHINPKEESHPNHHDIAVLVTRYDICSSPADCGLLGLANVAEVCNPKRSCCINEDYGLKLAVLVAHETGHVLSCGHDTGTGSDCKPDAPEGWSYVMAPFINSYTLQWSNCSRKFITEFLELGLGECLLDEPTEHHWDFPDMLPGAVYGPDEQCKMQFNKDYPMCDRGPDINCEALWCKAGRGCTSYGIAPLDGTKCANGMWCYRKKCIPAGQRPNSTDGGWGPWGPISRCSRTCGGGVSSQERECNNPPPASGGKYCTGERKRHFICNTTPCKPESLSFREQQCRDYNKVEIYGGHHNWTSYSRKDLNPCALYCMDETRTFAKLSPRMKDGTPCKLGTKNRCIAGVCREVGCDWKLDSGAQNDMCLQCEGNGVNCQKVEKTFTQKKGNGYVTMFKVPVDARNVKIIELKGSINVIAVSDVRKKTYYLNGRYAEYKDGVYNFGPGIKGVYVHPEREREELLIMGPTTSELLVHYIFFRGGTNPGVKLEYYMKTKPSVKPQPTGRYSWELLDWEECSVLCGGGTQVSRPKCVETKVGKVPDKFCDKIPKPKVTSRVCNRKACRIVWKVSTWSKCKMGPDGSGYKTRKIKCVRKANKKRGSDVVLDLSKCGKKISDKQKCKLESAHGRGSSLNIASDREYFMDYDETVNDDSRVFAKPLEYSFSDTLYNKMEDLSQLSNLQTEEKQSSFTDTKLTSGAEERRKKYPFGRIGKYENPTPRTVVDEVPPIVYQEAPFTERNLKLNEELMQDLGDKIPEDYDTLVLDTSKTKTYTGQEALKKLHSTKYNKTFSVTEN